MALTALSAPLPAAPIAGTAAADGIAELGARTLELERQALALDASSGSLSVFAGDAAADVLLREVTLQIDDGATVRYDYGDPESHALGGARLHRLLSQGLTPGSHRLHAEFIARYADAPGYGSRMRGHLDHSFVGDGAPVYLELRLVKNYLGTVALELHPLHAAAGAGGTAPAGAAADSFVPGSDADPQLRAADFLTACGHYLGAAEELLRVQAQNPQQALPAGFSARLDDSLAQLGANRGAASPTPDRPPAAEGATALERYNAAVALIHQGQGGQGVALLQALAADGALASSTDPALLALRDRANLDAGYYFLRQQQGPAAAAAFDRVRSPGPWASNALLGLGWALLAPAGSKDGGTAAEGTAVDAADGDSLDGLRSRLPLHPSGKGAEDDEARLRHALVPWVELIGRDPLDPAVQEGMLAIPYALDQIGAHEQAQEFYARAAATLEQARGKLDQAIAEAGSDRLARALFDEKPDDGADDKADTRQGDQSAGAAGPTPGHDWYWRLAAAPDSPHAFFVRALLGDDELQQAFRRCRDLQEMQQALDARLQGPAAGEPPAQLRQSMLALRTQIGQAAAVQRSRLRDLAVARLRERKRQTEAYLSDSRLALARIYDPTSAGGMP